MKEEVCRVEQKLRNSKVLLMREVSEYIDKMLYFKTQAVMIEDANEILTTYKQIKIRYTNIENKIFDLKMLYCENWEDDEEELDLVLDGLTQELIAYEQKVLDISREHEEILEFCMVLKSKPNEVGNKNLHDKMDKLTMIILVIKLMKKLKFAKK